MSRPPSNPPPPNSPEPDEPSDKPGEPSDKPAITIPTGLGLSRAQTDELIIAMGAVIWKVGCPMQLHADVLHDAFVMALCKPISERRPVSDWNRFVAWMCTLAMYAALTNRNTVERRRESYEFSDEEIAELLASRADIPDPRLRKALENALTSLNSEDQDLLDAFLLDGKSVKEIADKRRLPWSTAKDRLERALGLVRATLQSFIVAIVLIVAKNARAQGTRLARHVSQLFPHATQIACVMTVTVACGVIVPASSMATTVRQDALATVPLAKPETTITAAAVPRLPEEVAPVKLIGLDEPAEQWSASPMKSIKIASYLQATVVPFAFLVVPAMTQVACAGGGERQMPPPQEPEVDNHSGGMDDYEEMCESQRHLGGKCPSKADWYGSMGLCPDGTEDCKK